MTNKYPGAGFVMRTIPTKRIIPMWRITKAFGWLLYVLNVSLCFVVCYCYLLLRSWVYFLSRRRLHCQMIPLGTGAKRNIPICCYLLNRVFFCFAFSFGLWIRMRAAVETIP